MCRIFMGVTIGRLEQPSLCESCTCFFRFDRSPLGDALVLHPASGVFKGSLLADRLSDHRFWANAFRLLLHAAAFWLLDHLRRQLTRHGVPRLQLDTLRLRLLKVG